jgi:uncharacterized membrane protein
VSVNFEIAVEVAAPADLIWALMIEIERWPEWTASIKRVQYLDAGPLGLGIRVRLHQPLLPPAIWRVTQFVPGSGFVWESQTAGTSTIGEHWITAKPDSQSTVVLKLRQTGPLVAILRPFMSKLIRRYIDMEAQGLKQHSEALAGVRAL